MVHALKEIHRVLAPEGILIDLRPLTGDWPMEVASQREVKEAGRVSDMPVGLADDQAANDSIAQAAKGNWFVREQGEFFPFFYYWDSPNEMQEYIESEWVDFLTVEEAVWKNIRSLWAVADADARLRVRLKMMITRWKKLA
jgi:SAM-dependent methyltransferase